MRRKRILTLGNVFKGVGVAIIAFLAVFPLYWMINVSLLPESEVVKTNPHVYPPPSVATLNSYREIFSKYRVSRYMANSIFIIGMASLVTLFLSFGVAYSLAKYRFRWKSLFLYLIIWFTALPWIVYVLPIFNIANALRLLDTHILMIMLYGFSGIPLFSWFALPYILDFPDELIDAARLDGCSEWGIVIRVVMPALRNVLLALFILRFVWAYNDLLYSLSFTFHRAKMIMPAILEFPGYLDIPFAKMAAGGFIAVSPILVIVIVFQKYVISGLVGRTFK
jgi:multiple sugar transport system permease protein